MVDFLKWYGVGRFWKQAILWMLDTEKSIVRLYMYIFSNLPFVETQWSTKDQTPSMFLGSGYTRMNAKR